MISDRDKWFHIFDLIYTSLISWSVTFHCVSRQLFWFTTYHWTSDPKVEFHCRRMLFLSILINKFMLWFLSCFFLGAEFFSLGLVLVIFEHLCNYLMMVLLCFNSQSTLAFGCHAIIIIWFLFLCRWWMLWKRFSFRIVNSWSWWERKFVFHRFSVTLTYFRFLIMPLLLSRFLSLYWNSFLPQIKLFSLLM